MLTHLVGERYYIGWNKELRLQLDSLLCTLSMSYIVQVVYH